MAKKYIDADLLRKEIESRMGDCDANSKNPNQLLWQELVALLPFIDSLQKEQPIKVYRVENEKEQKGLWRKFDGTWEPLFDMLTDGQCKDVPMDDSPIYREGGKQWFASAPSKKTLQKWFSKRDLEELTAAGFTITEFEVVEYRKLSDFEYIFTRESIVNKTNINVVDIYPQEQPSEDLEAEMEKYFDGWVDDPEYGQAVLPHTYECVGVSDCKDIARHFYELGKQSKEPHYTKRNALFDKCVAECDPAVMKEVSDEIDEMLEKEQKPSEDLEEAAEEYRRESYTKSVLPNIDGPMPEYGGSIKDTFIAGAKWQESQMLKDAVEKTVGQIERTMAGNIYFIHGFEVTELDFPFINSKECGYGDKVKIVIVPIKED